MKPEPTFAFDPEAPSIHAEGALDLLGQGFRGDDIGGMAEWLKNSVDAYIREGVDDEDQHIVLMLSTAGRLDQWTFECVDFVGTTFTDVDEDFQNWCDPAAASKDGKFEDVFGGHGNGGKFHMRENFRRAELITYRDALLTVFRFERKRQGFDPTFKGVSCDAQEALAVARLDPELLPRPIQERFAAGDIRFTVVRGLGPLHMQRLRGGARAWVEKLQNHGQARQLLDRTPVQVLHNGKVLVEDLDAPRIEPKTGFEEPLVVLMPGELSFEGDVLKYTDDGSPAGRLILKTAKVPFPRRGDQAALNCVDIKGRRSIIASYRMHELGISNYQGAAFVYGVLESARLEEMGFKTNERKKLPENDYTRAVLDWIRDQVDDWAAELIEDVGREEQAKEVSAMELLNKTLNAWKNQLLRRFFVEVSAGPDEGPGVGGVGLGTGAGAGSSERDTSGGGNGSGKKDDGATAGEGGGQGDAHRRASRFPLVLVSGYDADPDEGTTIRLDPAQEVVYQRPTDFRRNIWWINAQRPLAERVLREDGISSARWRDYLFQRYSDIIVTYAIQERWREESEPTAELVSTWITEVIGTIHDSAARELDSFLFGREVESVRLDESEVEVEPVDAS